jgi:hypothetical protein
MSGTRPPNKDDSTEESSKDSVAQNEERQKKLKTDQPHTQSTSSTSSAAIARSSDPPPARANSFSFVPRQVTTAKRKSNNALPAISSVPSPATASSSNNLISSLLSRAQPTSAYASSSASVASSSLDEKATHNVPGYLILENQFAAIGNIAKLIAPIGEKQNKEDIDIYAISYGIILMSETLDNIKKNYLSYFTNHSRQIGIDYGFTTTTNNFENTLTAIKTIRDSLADHFIRIPSMKKFESFANLFILEDNFYKLAILNKQNIDSANPLSNKMLPQLNLLAKSFVNINTHSVSYADRLGFMISSLKRISEIKQLSDESVPYKSQAVAMLFVIAGTCARELARTNKERSPEEQLDQRNKSAERLRIFYETREGQTCIDLFNDLNRVRRNFAHNNDVRNNDLRNPEALKRVVSAENEEEYLERINPYIKNIVEALGQEYKPRPIVPPPTNNLPQPEEAASMRMKR